MEIVPIAFDSMGTRSMCTYVRTSDVGILIDPGVSLAPSRYGLPPHPLEFQRMEEHHAEIVRYAGEAEVFIVTHYHYDHHLPDEPELFEGKIAYLKHPTENINRSQRGRAKYFLEQLRGYPKRLEYADGNEARFGGTHIRFSPAVCHGTNNRLGYVVEISIECEGEKLVFTSDVEGPALEEQIQFILEEKPDTLIVDGPMTYMLGYRYSRASLEKSNENLVRAIREAGVQRIIIDHHFMRDLQYRERIGPVYEAARDEGAEVQSAAEFAKKPVDMLEAHRKELYKGDYKSPTG